MNNSKQLENVYVLQRRIYDGCMDWYMHQLEELVFKSVESAKDYIDKDYLRYGDCKIIPLNLL